MAVQLCIIVGIISLISWQGPRIPDDLFKGFFIGKMVLALLGILLPGFHLAFTVVISSFVRNFTLYRDSIQENMRDRNLLRCLRGFLVIQMIFFVYLGILLPVSVYTDRNFYPYNVPIAILGTDNNCSTGNHFGDCADMICVEFALNPNIKIQIGECTDADQFDATYIATLVAGGTFALAALCFYLPVILRLRDYETPKYFWTNESNTMLFFHQGVILTVIYAIIYIVFYLLTLLPEVQPYPQGRLRLAFVRFGLMLFLVPSYAVLDWVVGRMYAAEYANNEYKVCGR
jgi:hypothetical protein